MSSIVRRISAWGWEAWSWRWERSAKGPREIGKSGNLEKIWIQSFKLGIRPTTLCRYHGIYYLYSRHHEIIYIYTYLSIYPSIHPSIHPCIHPSIHPFISLSLSLDGLRWKIPFRWMITRGTPPFMESLIYIYICTKSSIFSWDVPL